MRGLFAPGFEVWRRTRASDGAGGWSETWAKQADVSGRLTPLSGAEKLRADQERGVVSHRFACAASVDLRGGDEVRAGARRLSVQAVRITSSGQRIEAVCEEAR